MLVVQSLWIGKMTLLEKGCIQSYIDKGISVHLYIYPQNPNQIVNHWAEGSAGEAVCPKCIFKDANEIIPYNDLFIEHNSYLPFSDLFRFELLYKKGGWWIDLDLYFLGNKANLNELQNKIFVFCEERTMVKGAYKSTEPTAPALGLIWSKYQGEELFLKLGNDIKSKIGKMKNPITGMRLIKDYKKCGYLDTLNIHWLKPEQCLNLDWWHTKEFFTDQVEFDKPNWKTKYGVEPNYPIIQGLFIHLWRNKCREKGINTDKVIPTTMYDEITKDYQYIFQ